MTLVETEGGAWAVLDGSGQRVWASPWLDVAARHAAQALTEDAAWAPRLSPTVLRRNRAQRAAWAQQQGKGGK